MSQKLFSKEEIIANIKDDDDNNNNKSKQQLAYDEAFILILQTLWK